jgi:hypothetical protein
MIINKELEWLRGYVRSIEYLLPKVKQVKKISSKKANSNRGQHFVGLITYYDKKSFRICLYTTYKDRNTSGIKPYNTVDILTTLAHELAHLEYWLHTTKHKQLECTILGIFMARLEKAGYISEEDEAKNGSFY